MLPREFFARPPLQVARELLGACVTRSTADGVVSIRLTEVEAYYGRRDPGSHAFRRLTPRNATMFGPAGRLYVYRTMGLHHCANIVCGPDGEAAAVLMRAGDVVEGVGLALARRRVSGVCATDRDIARGPGRLAVALALTTTDDGLDITLPGGAFYVNAAPHPAVDVETGPRVGVSGEGGTAAYPWRFWLSGEPTVSAYRPATTKRR